MTAEHLAQVEGLLIERKTEKAWLVDTGDKKVWVPISHIRKTEPDGIGEAYTITMTEWIATQKGLI